MIDKDPIIAGLLVRRTVRRFLNRCKFEGLIDYHEDKGLIESAFYLKGSERDLARVYKKMKEFYGE